MNKNLLKEIVGKTEEELDYLFFQSMNTNELGFDGTALKEAMKGVAFFIEKNTEKIKTIVCGNDRIREYISNSNKIGRYEYVMSIASLLAVWLPEVAAIIAAEKLVRMGLNSYCDKYIPQEK